MSIKVDVVPNSESIIHFDSLVDAITYACARYNLANANYIGGVNLLYKGKLDSQKGKRRGIQMWLYAKKGSLFMSRIVIYEVASDAGGISYDVESSVILGK